MSPDGLLLCNIPSNISSVLKGLRHTQINAGNTGQWQICGEVSISDSYVMLFYRSLWLHKGHFSWRCALSQSLLCYCTIVWLVDWVTPTLNVTMSSHFSLTNTAASCYTSNQHKTHLRVAKLSWQLPAFLPRAWPQKRNVSSEEKSEAFCIQ